MISRSILMVRLVLWDLINMMLEKQAGNRAGLIRRRVREQGQQIDFNPRTHVHAQIVSIAV